MQMLRNTIFLLIFAGLSCSVAAAMRFDDPSEDERGDQIMAKVFDQFFINYEMSITHKQGFYQEHMSENGSLVYIAEAIVDVYIPSNLNEKDYASVSPIRSRRKDFEKVQEKYLLLGNASDMARSSIWRPDSFLGEKQRDSYQFDYQKDSVLNGTDVYVIAFQPSDKSGDHRGKIYVDKERHGIMRVFYEPLVKNTKWWKLVVWQEDFVFRKGAYELQSVTFHGQSADSDYHYDAVLVMQQLKTVGELPSGKEFLPTRTSLFEQADSNPNESFWVDFGEVKKLAEPRELLVFEELSTQ